MGSCMMSINRSKLRAAAASQSEETNLGLPHGARLSLLIMSPSPKAYTRLVVEEYEVQGTSAGSLGWAYFGELPLAPRMISCEQVQRLIFKNLHGPVWP